MHSCRHSLFIRRCALWQRLSEGSRRECARKSPSFPTSADLPTGAAPSRATPSQRRNSPIELLKLSSPFRTCVFRLEQSIFVLKPSRHPESQVEQVPRSAARGGQLGSAASLRRDSALRACAVRLTAAAHCTWLPGNAVQTALTCRRLNLPMPRLRAPSVPGCRQRLLRSNTTGRFTVHALPCRCSHGLTHLSADGLTPRMVDVSSKTPTVRTAVARSEVELPPAGMSLLVSRHVWHS